MRKTSFLMPKVVEIFGLSSVAAIWSWEMKQLDYD